MSPASEIDRASEALYAIPFDEPEHEFFRTLCAAAAAGLERDTVRDWAAQWDRFNESEFRAHWKGACRPGPVREATLYQKARDAGWTDNTATDRQAMPAKASKRPPEPRQKPAGTLNASLVWNRCTPVKSHSYATTKGASPEALAGLRVVPAGDPLRIMGESMSGALVVPCWDGATLVTLQFITAGDTAARLKAAGKPSKLNLPGASVQGWFTVGELAVGGTAYLCEGIGAAWSCWQATGAASICCFGAGNMGRVAATLRQQDATAKLVICPDMGKESDAKKIASEHQCLVAPMPEGWPDNSDLNDLFLRDGFDLVQQVLEAATTPPKPKPLLKPVSVFDVLSNPSQPPAFVWNGYLPRGVVSLLGAHGGTGKSTIALMLGVCAALGRPLFSVGTEQCNVIFASFEDGAEIVRHRLAGISKVLLINPAELDGRLTIVDGTESPELFTADSKTAGATTATYSELRKLVQATGSGLVVIDNSSDSFGGDEINRRQVRGFIRALAQLARMNNCAVLLLGHLDKRTSRARKAEGGEGYSGSTAWHNSVRSRLFMSRAEDGTLTLEHQKSNFGRMREPLELWWPDGGLPMLAEPGSAHQQGRFDDAAAAGLLRLVAEFESRGQFCSTAINSRANVYAVLRSEPDFKALKLHNDDTKRIVNQCQRAGWLEPLDYRTPDRKPHERWTLTPEGRLFAGLPDIAPSAPSAPSAVVGATWNMAQTCAPSAPSAQGGMGGTARTELGAQNGVSA